LGRTAGHAVKKCGAPVECAEFLALSEAVAVSARRRGARNRTRGSDAVPIPVYARDLAREQRKGQTQPNNSFHKVRQLTCVMNASGIEALALVPFRSMRAAMSLQATLRAKGNLWPRALNVLSALTSSHDQRPSGTTAFRANNSH